MVCQTYVSSLFGIGNETEGFQVSESPSKSPRFDQLGDTEVKILKKLVRDLIDPTRDLGHVDRHSAAPTDSKSKSNNQFVTEAAGYQAEAEPSQSPSVEQTPSSEGRLASNPGCNDCS